MIIARFIPLLSVEKILLYTLDIDKANEKKVGAIKVYTFFTVI